MRGVVLLGRGYGLSLLGGGPGLLGEAIGGGEGGSSGRPVLRLLRRLCSVSGLPRHAASTAEVVTLRHL